MAIGRIKTFNQDRGFGFIQPDDDTGDVFVHVSQIVEGAKLQCGQRVEFTVGPNSRTGRPEAKDVRLIA